MNPTPLRQVNRWRDYYNPLRQLSMQRLAALFEQAERGQPAELQWLYRMIEKRDAVLRAGKRHRLAALAECDWTIHEVSPQDLPPGISPQEVKQQSDALRAAYESIDNLKEAIHWLGLAEFRGFSHLEKIMSRDTEGRPLCTHLEPVPQWYWGREYSDGSWFYNPNGQLALNPVDAVEINPDAFIIREVEDSINEIAAVSFLRRSMSQKDWDGFIETYGIPPLFAEMPPNIPPDREAEFQAMAEAVISDARGTLPHGAQIHTVPDGGRGQNPFRDHIQYQDSLVIMAITGGRLTTLSESTGMGSGQAQVHQDTFRELARAEAAEISEIFQRQFDLPLLTAFFPESLEKWNRPFAYFELTERKTTDVTEVIAQIQGLATAGYKVPDKSVSELTGYPIQPQQAIPALTPSVTKHRSSWLDFKKIFNVLPKENTNHE